MDSEESPLDVLSRAATMVSPPSYDESQTYSSKEMPCAKWRRERRQIICNKIVDAPLDFSTRHAAIKPPPSYDQSIQSKMTRPSVIQSVRTVFPTAMRDVPADADHVSGPDSDSAPPTEDVCDPAIDEHFRRSLGKDYSSIFSKDKKQLARGNNSESDSTGLTVDDHFAKALGDTWTKLKEKENEERTGPPLTSNNNNMLPNVKDLSVVKTDGQGTRKKKRSEKESAALNEKKRLAIASGWT